MILLFLLCFSIVSSGPLVVLVWELDCRRLRSFLIPKRSLFIGFFLLLDGSCAIDDYDELVFILHIRIVLTLRDMDSEGCLYPSSWDNLSTDLGCILHISSLANFLHVHSTKHVWCVTAIHQLPDELANASLAHAGFLGCMPTTPSVAISFKCLELYHQLRHCQSSFSIQAYAKVLCALHDVSLYPSCIMT